jgi:WD40 repeat protein
MGRNRPRMLLAVGVALTVYMAAAAACAHGGDEKNRAVGTPALDGHGDPLPSRAVSRLGTLRLLHHDSVTAVAFSADGRRFASVAGRTVVVWQWPDGRALQSLSLPNMPGSKIPSLLFAPDGRYLAALVEGNMTVWDVTTGKTVFAATPMPGPAFSSDGRRLAWRESPHLVRIRDLGSGTERGPYKRQHRVLAIAFGAKGALRVAEERPEAVVLCDPALDEELFAIDVRNDTVGWTQFTPGGERLVMQTKQAGIRLIDVRDDKARRRLTSLPVEGVPVALSPDGRKLLWRTQKDATLQIWDLEQANQVCTVDFYTAEGAQRSGAFSPDGKLLALGGTNHPHAATFWDTRTGHRAEVMASHAGQLYAMRFSPDGKEIATCTAVRGDPIVRFWDPDSGRLLRSFAAHRYGVHNLAYTPDGTKLITCGLWSDESICVWEASTLKKLTKLKAHRHGAGYVAVAPDGRRFASVSAGTTPDEVAVWDLKTGTQQHTHATLGQATQGIAFTSRHSLLICNWQELRRWDIGAPAALGEWSIGSGLGLCMDTSPDGRLALVGERKAPAPLRLIETLSGQEIARFAAGESRGAVALAPNGRTVAVGTANGEIRLLDWPSGEVVVSFTAHAGAVGRLSFSPDSTRLASTGEGIESATALVWNVADVTNRPLAQLHPSADEVADWCMALVGTDAAAAYRAAVSLRRAPRQAVAALKPVIDEHAKSAAPAIRTWIEELDSDVFVVRDHAHDALVRAGKGAAAQMVKALGGNPSVEQRLRLKHILNAVGKQPISSEQLSASRIVMVLEWIASADARALLQALAKGDPDGCLTEEAQASLQRLAIAKMPRP